MGFRQASGTKPSNLAAPVPGSQPVDPNAAAAQIKSAPMPNPGGSPAPGVSGANAQPINSPGPSVSPEDDLMAGIPHADDLMSGIDPAQGAGNSAAPDPTQAFDGQSLEHSLLGMKVKQDKDGKILIAQFPGSNSFYPPNAAQRSLLSAYLGAIHNAGALADSAAGSLGGVATGAELGSAFGPIGTAAGGILGGAFAAGGAAAVGASGAQDNLKRYLSDPDNAKTYYFLNKIAGPSEAMTPADAALTLGGGELLGGLLGVAGKAVSGKVAAGAADSASVSAARSAAADASAPAIDALQQAGNATGTPLTALEASAGQDGAIVPTTVEKGILGGDYGESLQQNYVNSVKSKIDNVKQFVNNIQNQFSGVIDDIGTNSESGYARGDKAKNFVSQLIDNQHNTLSGFREDVKSVAGNTLHDPAPVKSGINDILSQAIPGEQYTGTIDQLEKIHKNLSATFGDKETREFIGQAMNIQNKINESQAGSFGGVGLQNKTGLSFDYVNAMTDKLQRMSAGGNNPYVSQLSGVMRNFENNIIESSLKDAGNSAGAQAFLDAKSSYANSIGPLQKAQQSLNQAINNGSIGGWALNLPADQMRVLSGLTTDQQWSQMAGSAIRNGLFEEAAGKAAPMTAKRIEQFLLNDSRRDTLNVLIGKENVGSLDSAMKVLGQLEKKNLTPDAAAGQAKTIGKMLKSVKGLFVDDIVNYALYDKPEVAQMVKEEIQNYRKVYDYQSKGSLVDRASKAATSAAGKGLSGSGGATKLISKSSPLINSKNSDIGFRGPTE